jgi:medium-chain acyl-[acyl-carrier-protein] hydrolase
MMNEQITVPLFKGWITRPKPRPQARLRLFCLPYAGSGATVFRSWVEALPPEIELCPIQLPGRESQLREAPYNRLRPLVEALSEALRPYLNLPFAVFGHSLGALIGFELVRHLRRTVQPGPRRLFISARRAPHLPDFDSPIHQLPDAAFVDSLKKRYNGIPEIILQDAEMMRLFLPTLRADFAVLETYVYQDGQPLDCPISAYGGERDTRVSHEALAAWQAYTRDRFTLKLFPGDHFYFQTASGLSRSALLQCLTQELAQHLSY